MNEIQDPETILEGTDITFEEAIEAVYKMIKDYGDAIKKLGE